MQSSDLYRVPMAARWLGGLGAVPFIAGAILAATAPPGWAALAAQTLVFYGAVILSFLGGIQWGLAICSRGFSGAHEVSPSRLSVSVLPALVGWVALLLPQTHSLVLLACAFALVLLVDLRAVRDMHAPDWYPRLRWPLTLTAIVALTVGALA